MSRTISVLSASPSLHVFNLHETLEGLTIPNRCNGTLFLDTLAATSQPQPYPLLPGSESFIDLLDCERDIVRFPLIYRTDREPVLRGTGSISLVPGYSFATHFQTAMLLPPTQRHRDFRLITGIHNPQSECYQESIGYVELTHPYSLEFGVSVAIIASPNQNLTLWHSVSTSQPVIESRQDAVVSDSEMIPPTVTDQEESGRLSEISQIMHDLLVMPFRRVETFETEIRSPMRIFGIIVRSDITVITSEMFQEWETQLLAVAGVDHVDALNQLDWSTFIDRIPSIEFTVYAHHLSERVATRIILEPSDFIHVRDIGAQVKLAGSTSANDPLYLGLNVLRYVGLFLDYENSRVGFCEPL